MCKILSSFVFLALVAVTTAQEKTNSIQPHTLNIKYEYDALNRMTNIVYSNGMRIVTTFDAVGNVIRRQTFGPAKITAPTNVITALVNRKTEIRVGVHHDVLPISSIRFTISSLDTNVIPRLSVTGETTNWLITLIPPEKSRGKMATIQLVASDGFVQTTNEMTLSIK